MVLDSGYRSEEIVGKHQTFIRPLARSMPSAAQFARIEKSQEEFSFAGIMAGQATNTAQEFRIRVDTLCRQADTGIDV
jgi:hypothetical protein